MGRRKKQIIVIVTAVILCIAALAAWQLTRAETEEGVSLAIQTYENGGGDKIVLYQCIYADKKIADALSVVKQRVLDPAAADESRDCQVELSPAVLYQKDGTSYLWWEKEGSILIIEYDPQAVEEEEILKMAESLVPA